MPHPALVTASKNCTHKPGRKKALALKAEFFDSSPLLILALSSFRRLQAESTSGAAPHAACELQVVAVLVR